MVILCSNCNAQLMVPPEVAGKQVKCPLCKIVFVAPAVQASPPPAEEEHDKDRVTVDPPARKGSPNNEGAPSARKRDYDDEEDAPRRRRSRYDDEDDDRDRSRSWRGRYDDDDADYARRRRGGRSDMEAAEDAVAGPAVCLMVLGGLFALIGVFCFLIAIFEGQATPGGRAALLLATAFLWCWGGFIILGGVMMKTMKSYGLALAASIMALMNHPCLVLHLVFGIWAIVVLNKPEVKRAFRRHAEHNHPKERSMIDFDKSGGLVPAIAQDAETGEVLMLAWMNREAFEETVRTGRACLFQPQPQSALAQGRGERQRAGGRRRSSSIATPTRCCSRSTKSAAPPATKATAAASSADSRGIRLQRHRRAGFRSEQVYKK